MKHFKSLIILGLIATPYLLDYNNQAPIGIFFVSVVLWMSELIPLAVTALLIPVLAVSTGTLTGDQAFSQFGNQILFLFLGSFLLAAAMEKHRLDQRMSNWLLSHQFASKGADRIIFFMMALSAVLSMWISNTATTAMMIPLCLGISRTIGTSLNELDKKNFEKRILFTCAFAASVGGMATPVGSPPNLIAIEFLHQKGIDITFLKWMLLATPIMIVMLIALYFLLKWKFPLKDVQHDQIQKIFSQQLSNMGKMSRAELIVMSTFFLTVFLWVLPDALNFAGMSKELGKILPMGAVALIGSSLLFIIQDENGPILNWDDSQKIDWGTIMIFGGGLCLGKVLDQSGLAMIIGQSLFSNFETVFVIGLICVLLGVIISEFSSNTAAASLLIPIVLAKFTNTNYELLFALATALATSLGFMLPVSTPPNAIIYGTGKIKLKEMISTGIIFDLIGALSVLIIAVMIYSWLGFF